MDTSVEVVGPDAVEHVSSSVSNDLEEQSTSGGTASQKPLRQMQLFSRDAAQEVSV